MRRTSFSKIVHRAAVCVLAAACLPALGAGASLAAGSRAEVSASDGPAGGVGFVLNGQPAGVRITRIEIRRDGAEAAARPATTAQHGGATTYGNALSWPNGATGDLTATAAAGRPSVVLRVATDSTGPAELILHVAGADRLITHDGADFDVRSLAADRPTTVRERAAALQNRADQTGVCVTGGRLVVTAGPGGVSLAAPLTNGRAELTLVAFRGDATIAYEDVAKQNGTPAAAPGIAEARPARPVSRELAQLDARRDTAPPDGPQPWRFWTGTQRAFRPLVADPREAQIRAGLMYGRHAGKFLDVGLGGDLVVARKQWAADEFLTISARGLIAARLNTCESSFPLYNADFLAGVAAGYRRGDDAWELLAFHQSSHLGDEILEAGERRRIDYSHESVRMLWSHDFRNVGPGDLRLYGGPRINLRGFPEEIECKARVQFGGEYRWRAWDIPMYVAADAQSRHENDWDVNVAAQFGVELTDDERVERRPRVFVEFFNGFSDMGQYWDERETYILLGFGAGF